ncbi:S26 family signal peptidase [Halomarina pelagica]|uniref:S26 family signal peptidase n=1 Tax=Halomarina pelagica TaxID=2961599 RepID=UPI0020C34D99|nr:S26 family signal peptidase [Halomarina sp. BND7]
MTDSGEKGDRPVGLGWVRWLLTTDHDAVAYAREVAGSVAAVLLVGFLLFAVSGVWPPLVAIESESMEPHIQKGDLVFVMEEERFAGDGAITVNGDSTGVVTYQVGRETGYTKFAEPGDVIVYRPDGSERATPIIHRARFWVNEGENWYDEANPEYLGTADNCEELPACPAPNAGFITKGDNPRTNPQYDQVAGIASRPVHPSWVIGTAEFRVPLLGNIRLLFTQLFFGGGTVSALVVSLGGLGVIGVGFLTRDRSEGEEGREGDQSDQSDEGDQSERESRHEGEPEGRDGADLDPGESDLDPGGTDSTEATGSIEATDATEGTDASEGTDAKSDHRDDERR